MSDPTPALSLSEPRPEEYPRRFGTYTLLAPLARGGMGEVFFAKTGGVAGFEKSCVVKTLRPHLTDDREYVARFVDEARVVVQLGHRNICQVFDVGMVGERYYLAMEYIAGRDVKSLQTRADGERLDEGLAIYIVCEVLEALDYAHRHVDVASGKPLELVHRDISPQNIMVSFEGEVKLIDFGLAASTVKHEQTQPNVVMGKLAYMAPEQVRGDRVDGRADLFAACMCLYELLVGERFYEGRSPYEIWGIAAQGGFRPRKWDALTPALRDVLDRALAAHPKDRYATGLELRAALDAYRFEHKLRGDAPLLRALMQRLFVSEIEENRRLLQLLATTRPSDSGPTEVRASQEPTISIARAVSQPVVHNDATEPTGMVPKEHDGATRRTLLAAFALAALFAASLAFILRETLARPSMTQRAPVQEVVDTQPTAAFPATAPKDPEPPHAAASDAGLQTASLADPGTTEPLAAVRKRAKRDKRSRTKQADPPVPSEPAPPQESQPKEEPEAAAPVPRYGSISSKGKRIEILEQHCRAPCVFALSRRYAAQDWAASEASTAAFSEELQRCWLEICQLPR